MDRRRADRSVNETVSALHGLLASVGGYFEHALQPLRPHVSPRTVHTLLLHTRAEPDRLAASPANGLYVEDLTHSESGPNAIRVEVEAALGTAGP